MRSILRAGTLVIFLGIAVTLGCHSGDTTNNNSAVCQTAVDDISSPAAGVATLHGSFFSDETVIIQESDGTEISHGTPDTDRNAFSFGGIPSGTHSYHIIISCNSGRDDLGSFTFNVT